GIHLKAQNVAIDTAGTVKNPVMFDTVNFKGVAFIREARLKVDDLLLMSGGAGIRLAGQFVGGETTAGVFLAGRMRNIPAETVKKLWPPVVASGARKWINDNVIRATITSGSFRLAIPAEVIAAAINDQVIPDDMVELTFRLKDIDTRYYREMPPFRGARGSGRMTGNHFSLTVTDGVIALPGKQSVKFVSGTFKSRDLAAKVTPASVTIKTTGTARALFTLVDHKPLSLLKGTRFRASRVSGKGEMTLNIDMPLSKQMTEDDLVISASAKWQNAGFKNAVEGIDLTDGTIDIKLSGTGVSARGKAQFNGLASTFQWRQDFTKNRKSSSTFVVSTRVTEAQRTEYGFDLSRYVRGAVGLTLKASVSDGQVSKVHVKADLSNAILAVDEIDWVHPAGKDTRAEFDVDFSRPGRKISNFAVNGGGMRIRGNMIFRPDGGVEKADFPQFRLSKLNDMSLSVRRKGRAVLMSIKGKVFDARPLINRAFADRRAPTGPADAIPPIKITFAFDRIIANRGEIIQNAKGTIDAVAGKVRTIDIKGNFIGNSPVALRGWTNSTGGRTLQLVSRDAGATLRAANLYSKISGGTLGLTANLAPGGGIRRGLLVMRDFIVRNEEAFDKINSKSRKKKRAGPRNTGTRFAKLKL
ncbi:MAG TPA: hypothetical protein ENJ99_02545, partial [Rhizobiales bacterium]|nr:hypothetical protein [Hyphomicrobiales bacterium]